MSAQPVQVGLRPLQPLFPALPAVDRRRSAFCVSSLRRCGARRSRTADVLDFTQPRCRTELPHQEKLSLRGDSNSRPSGSKPAALDPLSYEGKRPAVASADATKYPDRESNPGLQVENLLSWPLDDRGMYVDSARIRTENSCLQDRDVRRLHHGPVEPWTNSLACKA